MNQAGSSSYSERSRAREMLVQSLYQMQLTDHGKDELLSQFQDRPEYSKIDQQYFDELLVKIYDNWSDLQKKLEQYVDIPISQMDPVELAILILQSEGFVIILQLISKIMLLKIYPYLEYVLGWKCSLKEVKKVKKKV